MHLRGRTLWLIGASSGIGAALAPRLAVQGVTLALSSRREQELNNVADLAATRGVRPLVKPLDATRLEDIERVYQELKAEWGRVEIAFYNAGTWAQARATNFLTAEAVNQIDVNLLGLTRMAGTVVKDMITNGEGEIIGMASLAGYGGLPQAAAYSASKAGEIAFLQALRVELKAHGVGVTTISPGFIKTALTDRNNFPMPFMISADRAAEIIIEGLLKGETEIHFPKRLSLPVKLLTSLPRPVWEAVAARLLPRQES